MATMTAVMPPMVVFPPEFVSTKTAGQMVELSHDTIDRAIRAGHLPSYKIGSRTRVAVDDLRKWGRRVVNEPGA